MKIPKPPARSPQKKQPYIVREIDARMLRKHPELSKGARMLWLTMLSMANAKTGELRHREHWYCGKEIDRRAEISDRTRQQQMTELIMVGLVRMEQERREGVLTDSLTGHKRWRKGVFGETHYFVFKSPHKDWFSYTAAQKSSHEQAPSITRKFSKSLESRNTPNKTEGRSHESPHKQGLSTARKFYRAARISATSTSVLHREGGGSGVAGDGGGGGGSGVEANLSETHQTPPLPACPVELRQDHSVEPVHGENRKNGKANFSLATIEPEIQRPAASPSRLPPVVAFYKKHGKLPPYILDETQLLWDSEKNFIGYVDRNGNRHDAWNNYESIHMTAHRRRSEVLEKFAREAEQRAAEARAEPEPPERPPGEFTREQKLQMLRLGTKDEELAERWSARSGIPARIFLIKDNWERAYEFKIFLDSKKAGAAPNGNENATVPDGAEKEKPD